MSRPLTAAIAVLMVAGAAPAGDLTERYQLTLHRVLSGGQPPYSAEFILADVLPRSGRIFTEYSGDLSGRYVEVLSAAALEFSTSFPTLDSLVPKILPLQKEPGYFGAGFNAQNMATNDAALLWGNGRLLIGLLEYYRLHPKPEVLEAARRIGKLFHGPWPLALDDELTPAYFNDPFWDNKLHLRIAADGSVNLEREPSVKLQRFSVPVAHLRVNYSQEAYPMLPPSPATLRPIAEQTGTRSISWQYWFNEEP